MKPLSEASGSDEHTSKVDMSPEAIDARLDMVSSLYDLRKYLQTARPSNDAVDVCQESEAREDENA
tara:strand:- start:67666 stop:67863 length:198 start_codon:yes stop_codon:yes gene_type:complete